MVQQESRLKVASKDSELRIVCEYPKPHKNNTRKRIERIDFFQK